MVHLPELIEDLALILMAGAITTLLFRRIKQPLVLGYIIAGFSLVWIANTYMSLYSLLRTDIKVERIDASIKEQELNDKK